MSNKKIIRDVFEQKFSSNQNYQEIMEKVSKKQIKTWQLLLTPTFSVILILFGIFMINGNPNIHVNDLSASKISKMAEIDIYLTKEYNIKEHHSFVGEIIIPEDFTEKKESITFTEENDKLNIHDYIVTHYNNKNQRRIIISFSMMDVESLRDNPFNLEELKKSRINDNDVTIGSLENRYYAFFEYKDFNFEIEATDITLRELIKLIESIILEERK